MTHHTLISAGDRRCGDAPPVPRGPSRTGFRHDVPPRDRRAGLEQPRPLALLSVLVRGSAVLVGLGALAMFVLAAWGKLGTLDYVGHVSGGWIGQAYHALHHNFFPALYDPVTGQYGGTRNGPLGIAIQALATKATGSYIVGGKLCSMVGMLLAMTAGGWLIRKESGSWAMAVLFPPLLMLTPAGWTTGLSVRHDGLATAMQLVAVALFIGDPARKTGRAALAAVLCGSAIWIKPSGIWGGLTVLVYLLLADRRALGVYLGVGLATVAAWLGMFQWLSSGRFWAGFWPMLFAGSDPRTFGPRLIDAAKNIALLTHIYLTPMAIVLPLAGVFVLFVAQGSFRGNFRGSFRGGVGVLRIGLGVCAAVTLYIMTSPGTGSNHLIDLYMLALVCVGIWVGRAIGKPDETQEPGGQGLPTGPLTTPAVGLLLAGGVMWLALASLQTRAVAYRLSGPVAVLRGGVVPEAEDPGRAYAVLADIDKPILAANAIAPILLGQPPVITDPFMLRIHAAQDPPSTAPLLARIRAKAFGAVVTLGELDQPWGGADRLDRLHWGPAIGRAILANYRVAGRTPRGEVIYRPIPTTDTP